MKIETDQATKSFNRMQSGIKAIVFRLWKQRQRQLMIWPGILFLAIFSYIPMYGVIIAFKEYDIFTSVYSSRWVGLRQFEMLFQLPNFHQIIRNTLIISFAKLVIGFPVPIILALMLNELTSANFKRSIQTISYLPHFMSWVIVAGFTFEVLSLDGGTFNHVLLALKLINEPIAFLMEPSYFYGITVLSQIWKEAGWGAIIYLAAVSSIDLQLYEAAEMDGATRLRKIWHITLPGIRSTVVILLILAVSGLMNAGFEQILLLSNPTISSVSEVLDTYVYRVGIQQGRYSLAAAAGLFTSAVSFMLLLTANYVVRKLKQESLF